jgi:hypothetical protein
MAAGLPFIAGGFLISLPTLALMIADPQAFFYDYLFFRVEFEAEVVFPRHRLEDTNALRHDLVADPVARNDGDAHVV